MRIALCITLLPSLALVAAWDFSVLTKAVQAAQQTFGFEPELDLVTGPEPVRIAIIGAGAGGSSAGW